MRSRWKPHGLAQSLEEGYYGAQTVTSQIALSMEHSSGKLIKLGRNLLAGTDMFSKDVVEVFLTSDDLELRTIGYMLTVNEGNRLEGGPTLELLDSCAHVLMDSCQLDLKSDHFSFNRWDCGQELARLFSAVWRFNRERYQLVLEKIRWVIGNLWMNGSEEQREAILLGACEHLFVEPEWRDFFANWRRHAKLRLLFDEASALADKWREL